MNTSIKRFGLVAVLLSMLASIASAQTTVDLTAVTDGMSGLATAALAAGATVIAAAIGLMAVKFGGKWVVRVFKSFTS